MPEDGISTELLWRIGEALWGPAWMHNLSVEFDINGRKVRRWAGGNGRAPLDLRPKLVAALRERGAALEGLVEELERPA